MLDQKQTHHLKEELLALREDLQKQVEMQSPGDESLTDSVGEVSSYDNHPADLGTELFEKVKDIALVDHNSNELEKVNEALQAIEEGSYGKCIECGNDIPYERLEALPFTLYCLDHASTQNVSSDRPAEEDVLEPSHKDSFQRLRDNHIINDDIDSFEEVARYGTSETPADYFGKMDDYNSMDEDKEDSDGFTEDYESFAATDIKGENTQVFSSKKNNEFEQTLDEQGIESNIGDIPYHERDSYLEDKAGNIDKSKKD
ncbi:YteA family regulatory protein [Peribacillus deserti]|uniref:YteA family regulatory protein n=1 Tax=Peribacillus deserti TaxID=673318 RepID=A0ABS2QIK8_9BACI|nr:TraR/DksA C4-type zinc finger protein [Peribacillus deserti]MBM7692991.1 YteA family regulatory protein [Peribacillus deserti]